MSNTLEHLAIIMDGNGRWAKAKGLSRTKGHEKGAKVIEDITTYCANHPTIKSLTLYAFSTENWKRPKLEVEFLMKLLGSYLKQQEPLFIKENVKFQVIGQRDRFSASLQKSIANLEEKTKHHTKLTQVLALNYGGRDEIAAACNQLKSKETITPEDISKALQTPYEDIDLLIRTSGEQRLSNFLLWQCSYSEFFFTPTLWPDFKTDELDEIIANFEKRERRYGGL